MNLEEKSAGELFRHLDKESQKEVLFNLICEVVRVDLSCSKILDYACNYISFKKQTELKNQIITYLRNSEKSNFLTTVFEENKILSEKLSNQRQRNYDLLEKIRGVQSCH